MEVNKSKAYILPLLNYYIDLKFINKIKNTYLFLENDLESYIIVKYGKNEDEEFQNYLIELSTNDYCKEVVIKEKETYCIFTVFEEVREDYESFVIGKFSKISIRSKKEIVSFSLKNYGAGNIKTINKIKQILDKDTRLKREIEEDLDVTLSEDSELSSLPNLENETIRL